MLKTFPTICASVAVNPSPLGVFLHNAGYKAMDLDYTYIAMGTTDIVEAINALRQLNYRGMGVSMPFKQTVINYLDKFDESVKIIGACNTVVNENNNLIGYNTDWIGAQEAIKEVIDISKLKKATIIGAGGVARALAYTMKVNGIDVNISARRKEQRQKLVLDLNLSEESSIENQGNFNADIVINATPISTSDCPLILEKHPNSTVIFDVVFQTRMTKLTQLAKSYGKSYISGWRMLLWQAVKQFELYTGVNAPVKSMEEVLKKRLPEQ